MIGKNKYFKWFIFLDSDTTSWWTYKTMVLIYSFWIQLSTLLYFRIRARTIRMFDWMNVFFCNSVSLLCLCTIKAVHSILRANISFDKTCWHNFQKSKSFFLKIRNTCLICHMKSNYVKGHLEEKKWGIYNTDFQIK